MKTYEKNPQSGKNEEKNRNNPGVKSTNQTNQPNQDPAQKPIDPVKQPWKNPDPTLPEKERKIDPYANKETDPIHGVGNDSGKSERKESSKDSQGITNSSNQNRGDEYTEKDKGSNKESNAGNLDETFDSDYVDIE